MTSRVYFRFSSSTDFDYVAFDGEFINIGELKYLISKKTGVLKDRSTVIELFDSRTEEEYINTKTMVPKNASVVAKRSPAVRPPPISTSVKKQPQTEANIKEEPKAEEDDILGPGMFAPESREEADNAAISQLVKGLGDVWNMDLNLQTGWKRGIGQNGSASRISRRKLPRCGRANLPPLGYICHRCKTPGHFIEDCPTNGNPAYDFIRVRYPTGIPTTMLEKDEQGGLLMPNGERARLKPNRPEFEKEMAAVPSGEPSIKALIAPQPEEQLPDQNFLEVSGVLSRNPLATLTPLVLDELPEAYEDDLKRGFFQGRPLDQTSFNQCLDDYRRAKEVFVNSDPPPAVWNQPLPPAPMPDHWRKPMPPYGTDQWMHRGMPFSDYAPSASRKPMFMDHRAQWRPGLYDPYYDMRYSSPPGYYHHGHGYHSVTPAPPPPPSVDPMMDPRIDRSPPPNTTVTVENGAPVKKQIEKELPYGFEHALRTPSSDRHRTSSTSKSKEKRRLEHEASNRSPSTRKSKSKRKSGEKSHHRHREGRSRRRRVSSSEDRSRSHRHKDVELDRWPMMGIDSME